MNVFVESGITHLDLHRVRHHEAQDLVIDFTLKYQDSLPLIIICGNSKRMIDLAKEMLTNNDIIFSEPRYGIIRIESL